jgi:predicted Fe-Mo cluster-binding NifX family protein
MKLAFPVEKDDGMASPVFGHFGSAPYFVVVESENGSIESFGNRDRVHLHGQCQPIAALSGRIVDAVVVGGIGAGALMKLNNSGIRVYRAVEGTVSENLALFRSGRLPEMDFDKTCAGHQGGGHCAH